MDAKVDAYLANLFGPEDDALREIVAEIDRNGLPHISVTATEGRLIQWLMHTVNARKVVEFGTLAGYSGVWIARALPEDGRLWTVEKSPQHAEIARRGFQRAGVADRIELLQGEANGIFGQLSQHGPFDFVFVDAEKSGYPDYLEWSVENLRPGGIVAAHNAIRSGAVLNPMSENDYAMRNFNLVLAKENRLDSMIIDMGDGMAVGIKKA